MQPTALGMSTLRRSDVAALTRTQVAELFGVDVRTITSAIQSGQLPCVRVGRLVFVPREPLLAMLSGDAEAADPSTEVQP